MAEIQHKTKEALYDQDIPNLVELQINSYDWFKKEGLKELLDNFSPITNYDQSYSLEFIGNPVYEKPQNTEDDCRSDMTTYEGKVKVKVRFVKNEDGVQSVTEEDVFLTSLPEMTDNGTFFINGAERVVVSQLSRSPGAYFELNFDNSGKPVYVGKILPVNGGWLEMFTEGNEMRAHIGQTTKFPITVLLRAFSRISEGCPVNIDKLLGQKLRKEITAPDGTIIYLPKNNKTKSKKSSKEVDILKQEHLDEIKKYYPAGYIYSKDFYETSTTTQILDIFGKRDFIKISQVFMIDNYVEIKGEFQREELVIYLPLKSSNNKLNNLFRVLDTDIYSSDKKIIFAKGTKVDDAKNKVNIPIGSEIYINDERLDRAGIIDYLAVNGVDSKYKKAIDGLNCESCNLLVEYLQLHSKKDSGKIESYYNIENRRTVKNIIRENGEIKFEDEDITSARENLDDIEILCKAGELVDKPLAKEIYDTYTDVFFEYHNVPELVSNTIKNESPKKEADKKQILVEDSTSALLAFQRYVKPNDPPSENAAETLLKNYFFDNKRYDVGKVGRYKLNRKLGLSLPEFATNVRTRSITKADLIKLMKYTIYLSKDGKMVSSFYGDRKEKVLEEIDKYISLVKKNEIEGIKSISVIEKNNQEKSDQAEVYAEVICSKFEAIENSILDGRLSMYSDFRRHIEDSENGYLFTKDEYVKLYKFLQVVADTLGKYDIAKGNANSEEELYPEVRYALSDSPANLKPDYVLLRVNPCITDEIDHLENKRVRSVGELLQDQLRTGFARLEKAAKEKMNANDKDNMSINNLVITKSITSCINAFFQQGQLSQFMDQTNPLAELTHKRRLSALGPGGLSRQSAKIEVRDVHHSHYGRICPIETPEGPNIGLIGSMAIHARINDFGFLETPYRIVRNGVITDEIRYLSAEEESHEYIATANVDFDSETKKILSKTSVVRHNGKYPNVDCNKITLMEISPNQIMSVAANLIPFIENDDANRALMGSNMQRQAVPLLKPTAPIVRTGIEGRAAHDSGVERFAKRDGKVVWVSCESVVVLPEEPDFIDEYTVTLNVKKTYEKRDNLLSCTKKRFAFDDKEKKSLISEETIAMNSNILRKGVPSNIQLDDVKYLSIDVDKESEIKIDWNDQLEKNDLIFNNKIYKGKGKSYKYKCDLDCKGLNGIVKEIKKEILAAENDGDDPIEIMKLTVVEYDVYCLQPKICRNAFPKDYAVIKFGNIEVKAATSGVGTGNDNHIVLNEENKKFVFDVVVCDDVRLINMIRSNQGTCINSRAVVEIGRRVYADELLADGPCTDHGELALGQNVTVAFLPWNGYNYEDAILLNQRLVKDDKFSSIHIEKYEIESRDTKAGVEEITRDIPNVSEESLKDLDERGIIKVGASVKAESILVGKVAPKAVQEQQPEDKLLKSIFGSKAEEIRDVSLRVPHGENGIVVDVKVFSRFKYKCTNSDCGKIVEAPKKLETEDLKCERCGSVLEPIEADEVKPGVNQTVRVYIAQKRKIMIGDKMAGRHGNKGVISNILQEADMPFKPDGNPVDIVLNPLGVPSRMNIGQILETHQGYAGTHLGLKFKNPIFQSAIEREIIADLEIMTSRKLVEALLKFVKELEINVRISDRKLLKATNECIELVKEATGEKLEHVADPLTAIKNDIYAKVLDEIKGYDVFDLEILSRNLCADPVVNDFDEFFETNLAEIIALNHKKFKAQLMEDSIEEEGNVIDDIDEIERKINEIKSSYNLSVPTDYDYQKLLDKMEKIIIKRVGFYAKLAKTDLYDGKTGDKLNQPVAVGTIYMLKLHHLVDDKMHARATGPYSLVTQQPLGGKAQFGGQRFGEMEVWALEAYGAAYTLQEILTIKSDDVLGRQETYDSIVKGKSIPTPGIPESFKILVNELQSLCLKVTVEDEENQAIDIRTYDDTPIKIR